jgi:hypothetical protein
MFNPLAPMSEKALKSMIEEGHIYFVRQTFNRAKDPFDEGIKGYYLFCHYKTETLAKEHYDALRSDPNRFLYNWQNEAHKLKLLSAASHPAGYKLYTNTFIPDWEKHITNRMKQKVRAYINKQGWRPSREEGVDISFYPHFGEVMVTLRFRRQEVKIKFEEIEKQY